MRAPLGYSRLNFWYLGEGAAEKGHRFSVRDNVLNSIMPWPPALGLNMELESSFSNTLFKVSSLPSTPIHTSGFLALVEWPGYA